MRSLRPCVALLLAIPCVAPVLAQECLPTPSGLVAWWPGDGSAGDVANDHDGTLFGDVHFTAGKVRQGFDFDGTDDYMEVVNTPDLNPTAGMTVGAWVYPRPFGGTGNNAIVDKPYYYHDYPYYQYHLGVTGVDYPGPSAPAWFEFDVAAGGGRGSAYRGPFAYTADKWYLLVGTYDRSYVRLYVDGVLWNQQSRTGAMDTFSRNLRVATFGNLSSDPRHFTRAIIDEVFLFSRALTAVEIQQIYAAGSAGMCALPTASAGPDQTVDEFAAVTLHGSGSDPLGHTLGYSWTQLAGPAVTLSGSADQSPTFTAPAVTSGSATLTFGLIVSSKGGVSPPDVANVTVRNANQNPVAETTGDQTVPEGSTVALDGTPSFDPEGTPLAYAWSQLAGSSVTLTDPTSPTPQFGAPTVGCSGETLTFQLVVSDGIEESAPAQCSIHVTNVNQPPVAIAGAAFAANENSDVALAGSGNDPDLDPLRYSWTQIGGSPILLSDPTSPTPHFWAPFVSPGGEDFAFRLIVSDGLLDSAPSDVAVQVLNTNDPPSCAVAVAAPARVWPPNHALVPVGIQGIVDPQGNDITIAVTGVMQDEPTAGLGDGDTSPDAVLQGSSVLVRAERSGSGDGRIYAISFVATDEIGESCSGVVKVAVPHSMKKGAVPGDGGPLHDSTLP